MNKGQITYPAEPYECSYRYFPISGILLARLVRAQLRPSEPRKVKANFGTAGRSVGMSRYCNQRTKT
jgi:hypothetical protein